MFASPSCPRAFAPAVCLLATLGLASSLNAAVTIDFESAPQGAQVALPYTQDGFKLSVITGSTPSQLYINNPNPGTSSSELWMFGNGVIRLEREDGGLFDAMSVYVPAIFLALGSAEISSSEGGLRPLANADSGTIDLTALPNFTHLSYLEFTTTAFEGVDHVDLDNITVNAIPEPASLGLLGSVAAMALRRRRR